MFKTLLIWRFINSATWYGCWNFILKQILTRFTCTKVHLQDIIRKVKPSIHLRLSFSYIFPYLFPFSHVCFPRMEPEPSCFFQFLPFLLLFLSSLLLLYSIKLKRGWWCNCEICDAYLTLSWSKQFHNLCDWYSHLLKNSPGKTIHIHVLGNTITANPDNVEYILKTRFENFPKGKPFSMILGDLLGRGIFNVDGDLWRFQKKMASLELDRFSIRSYAFEIINYEINHRLVPLLSSTGVDRILDLQDIFRRFSFDSICRFSFGLDPKCLKLSLPISEFAIAFDLASKLSAQRAMTPSPLVWKIKRWLNIGSEKQLRESIRVVNVLAREVISQRRKMGLLSHKDLLSRFMNSLNDETYLRDIVVSFLLAGRYFSSLYFDLIIKNNW